MLSPDCWLFAIKRVFDRAPLAALAEKHEGFGKALCPETVYELSSRPYR